MDLSIGKILRLKFSFFIMFMLGVIVFPYFPVEARMYFKSKCLLNPSNFAYL